MGGGRGEFGQAHLGRKQVRGEEGGCKENNGGIHRDFGDKGYISDLFGLIDIVIGIDINMVIVF